MATRRNDGLLGVAQLALQDLAGRALRQLVDDLDDPRVFVGGEPLLAEGRSARPAVALASGFERDDGLDLFAVALVGDADHRGLDDGFVLVEHFLDLARIDVEAAAQDHVLLAVDDPIAAVVVAVADVARVEPAVLAALPSCASGRFR